MDDQRCQLDEPPNGENAGGADPNTLNDMIGQSDRLSDAQEISLFLKEEITQLSLTRLMLFQTRTIIDAF